ncbi:hypothetical protein GCM10010172_21050 [Paractinoplanes ferrugineus]|uniref:Uncharacterized protein n=1 Tax=Paractinoplanes ferrugineus TaxID=113564 RepID=A0A919IVJ7_9ACTN|nr:DUF6232 family protein [Actinoplanes ferrugineus]GIE08984.1 hypothetical protein Afe05nite_08240 [Actinoplanes ferrugineus]
MTTYYRDPDVRITSAGIRMAGRDFAPAELIQVWHRRGRRSWGKIAGRGMIGMAMLLPIAVGLLGVGVALVIDASTPVTVGLIGGGILIGLASAPLADILLEQVDRSHDRGSRELEIWARTATGDVRLLRTADASRFGRIYRALQRALEPAGVTRR